MFYQVLECEIAEIEDVGIALQRLLMAPGGTIGGARREQEHQPLALYHFDIDVQL